MILNSEFWEALTGAQRRRFAKANCEATYKKSILYQVLATILGILGIGLFLPVANKASKYWKGYYSLREENMPVAVTIMCGINFVLGLFANVVLMFLNTKPDYGMFVNTLSRRRLEAMLNEPENDTSVNAHSVTDDPFRIANFTTAQKPIETRPVPKGCEKFPSAAMLAVCVGIIVLGIVIFSLLFSSCSGDDVKGNYSSGSSSDISSQAPTSSALTKEDFGELDKYPSSWSGNTTMQVKANDFLSLRSAPESSSKRIAKMPTNTVVTVLNSSDKKDWCFVAYKTQDKTLYGWACTGIGDTVYLVPYTEPESSESGSVDPSKLFTKDQLKEMAAAHIQAIVDAENGFVSYVEFAKTEEDIPDENKAVVFGTDGDSSKYYLVTNAANSAAIKSYLDKYLIGPLATSKSNIEVVAEDKKDVLPESPVVSFNGSLYVSNEASVDIVIKMDTFEVLSYSEKSYVVSVSGISDDKDIVKFNINLQYVDEVLLVSSYKRS